MDARERSIGSFVPIFDLEPTLSVGALALDATTSPNPTLYVGSGEGNGAADSYYGAGVFVSSDLGLSWTQLGASQFAHASISSIAVDTTRTPRAIYAAATYGSSANRADASWVEGDFSQNGLWRSGDGGESWISYPAGTFGACPYFTNDPCPAESVAIDSASPAVVLVSILGVGVFRSSNSGFSWTQASLPSLTGGVGRASVAAGNGVAYAAVGAADGIEFAGFYKSADDGVSWTQVSVPSATVGGTTIDGNSASNFSQSFFDQTLAIDPADTTGATVVFGGVGIYRSTNSGGGWTSLVPSGGTHSDQHAIAFDPASAHSFYVGNDGGLYRFDNGSQTWAALNSSIAVAQAQSIGPHPTNNNVAIAGLLDNGTARFDGTQPPASSWTEVDNLDGGFALFDAVNPAFAYHTFATTNAGAWVSRSTDGGVTFNSAASSAALQSAMATAGDDGAAYFPPLACDPAVAQRVLFGAHSVYVSNDGMATWSQQTTQDLTGGCRNGQCALEDLEIAPSDRTKAYALAMETSTTFRPTPFKIFTTDQADLQVSAGQPEGAHWTDKTAQLPPIVFPDSTQATGIAIDPFNSSVAWLSLSGFTAATGMGHIFVTTDFGGSWTQADGNPTLQSPPPASALPDVPVLRLLVDRNDATAMTVLAATDIGVFRTTDGGNTWAPFNLGTIPAVAVFDIEQNLNGVIFAATHGRGIFELSGEGSPGTTPTATPTSSGSATRTATATPSIYSDGHAYSDTDRDRHIDSHRDDDRYFDRDADCDDHVNRNDYRHCDEYRDSDCDLDADHDSHRHGDRDADCNCDRDRHGHGDRNCDSHANCNGDGHSNCDGYADSDSHRHDHRNTIANADGVSNGDRDSHSGYLADRDCDSHSNRNGHCDCDPDCHRHCDSNCHCHIHADCDADRAGAADCLAGVGEFFDQAGREEQGQEGDRAQRRQSFNFVDRRGGDRRLRAVEGLRNDVEAEEELQLRRGVRAYRGRTALGAADDQQQQLKRYANRKPLRHRPVAAYAIARYSLSRMPITMVS